MKLYAEEQIFIQNEYDASAIQSRSRFHHRQVSQGENVWIACQSKRSVLEDTTDYLQLGQSRKSDFYSFLASDPQPSGWVNFPSKEKPGNYFKYASFDIDLNQDVSEWSR